MTMSDFYCTDCADVVSQLPHKAEEIARATFIAYGKSLCSLHFYKHKKMDDDYRRAMGDPDLDELHQND